MTVFLTSGDAREAAVRALLSQHGITPDSERSAFSDPEVCGWGIQDPPCLIELHRGASVWEAGDTTPQRFATFTTDAAAAVAAYDAANPVTP